MLLFNLPLLLHNPRLFMFIMGATAFALLLAITVHEFSHAWVANNLGDYTARRLGRLTLNPLAHLDTAGTVLLLLVGFGWGKPVPVNPYNLRTGPKSGMAAVALAGPLSNFITAGLFAIPIRLGITAWHSPFSYTPFSQQSLGWMASDLVALVILYNLILGTFNLIPLAPLDGFNVAVGSLPGALSAFFRRLERYGPVVLFGIIGIGYFTGFSVLSRIMLPVVSFFATVLVGRPL